MSVSTIRSNGIVAVNDSVLQKLQFNHPKRHQPVTLPPREELKDECADRINVEEKSEEFSNHVSSILQSVLSSVTVTAENILKAAKSARRLTSRGLQQITPWHLKRALLAVSNQSVVVAAGRLSTRWARGDFSSSLGKLEAE